MTIINELDLQLRNQAFEIDSARDRLLSHAKQIAQNYCDVENAISVLSDLEDNKSYIFYGKYAETIGLHLDMTAIIDSIWEKNILTKIHPEDLQKKYLMELQFFHFIRQQPLNTRDNFYINSTVRMKNKQEEWISVKHRMFYIRNSPDGSIWLALCLYQCDADSVSVNDYQGKIINTMTGQVIVLNKQNNKGILSKRELEILKLIKQGKNSKIIAIQLSISNYTVNRHRQNILQKLNVKNSLEACKIAESLLIL